MSDVQITIDIESVLNDLTNDELDAILSDYVPSYLERNEDAIAEYVPSYLDTCDDIVELNNLHLIFLNNLASRSSRIHSDALSHVIMNCENTDLLIDLVFEKLKKEDCIDDLVIKLLEAGGIMEPFLKILEKLVNKKNQN